MLNRSCAKYFNWLHFIFIIIIWGYVLLMLPYTGKETESWDQYQLNLRHP